VRNHHPLGTRGNSSSRKRIIPLSCSILEAAWPPCGFVTHATVKLVAALERRMEFERADQNRLPTIGEHLIIPVRWHGLFRSRRNRGSRGLCGEWRQTFGDRTSKPPYARVRRTDGVARHRVVL
jgi:hypothetical protein